MEWADEDLFALYRHSGDRRAFEELIRRYERELYNYLRQYLGDPQMAEDAFQSTFLQVHLKCNQFEEGRKFRPWLYAVATNQAIDSLRRSRRHRAVSLDRAIEETNPDEVAANLANLLLNSQEQLPAEQLESAEQRDLVRRAIDELPEPLRKVLLLVYFQGLKYREAAEALSLPVGTVKSRLHAAVRRLERSLREHHLPAHV